MDILLLNPYYSQFIEYYSFYRPNPPVGLLYIASYLKKYGMDSRIYELGAFDTNDAIKIGRRVRFGRSDEEIADIIKKEKPKIVGITSMYSIYYKDVVEIATLIKKTDSNIKIVVGGNHASSYWRHILKNKSIDFVVIGEGEETFLELAKSLLDGGNTEDICGIAHRGGDGSIMRTNPRELIKDLDEIPFPALDLVDYERYLGEGNPYSMHPPSAGIVSSRGCPGNCVFCTVKAVWGRTWRGRSPTNVVDEIEYVSQKYGVREFGFMDDSTSVNRKRWEGICDEIIKRNLNIKWTTPNGIAHWALTKQVLNKMYKAGCYRITFGIESGHPKTREFLGKPYSLQQAKELIQHANRIGMWTNCTNIIGFPYEDLDSINQTIAFAKKSGTDFACFYLLLPQPTSDVYQYFKKEGLLNFDSFFEADGFDEQEFEKINYILNEIACDTVHFKGKELNRLQKKAYRSFIIYRAMTYLFNPLKLIRKIHSMEDFKYILRSLSKGIRIFFRTLNPLQKKSSDYYLYPKSKASIGR